MFAGSSVALVTPMRPDGAIDHEAWLRLLDFQLQGGTTAVVVGGTTGESATLEDAELRHLVESAVQHTRGRIKIIAGAGTSSTASTLERVRWLGELGVDGLLIVTPAYVKPTQEGETGRIVTEEASLHASNVMLYSTDKKVASRVEIVVEKDGTKKRRLKKTGEIID